ncbi:MAG: UDP-N-acetylmuramoyl-L-alanine--D-glutamate ligase, partial [Synergistaceae bacterium]|nr:UDP-N-acetylmuramoyl-L-alanine--D-glutamate ligase [Synergistaceae bacterium]
MSRKVTVIGAGVSGQGLAMLAHNLGLDVFVSEQKKIADEVKERFTKNNIAYEEGHTEKVFEGTSEILISSGIPPKSEIIQEAQSRNV